MLSMLLAYNATGEIVATLDYLVMHDEEGNVTGLADFEAHENTGGEMTAVWTVEGASGSKTWPEWIGGRAHDFRVELEGSPGAKRISALVHKASGHRRTRADVEAAIASRIAEAPEGTPADIRDIVGGPDRPLLLYKNGRTKPRPKFVPSTLPLVRLEADS